MIETKCQSPTAQPVLLMLVCFATGIYLDSLWDVSWRASFVFTSGILLCWFFAWSRSLYIVSAVLVLLAFAGAGCTWHHVRWNWIAHNDLSLYSDRESKNVCVVAEVLGDGRRTTPQQANLFDPIPSQPRTMFRIRPVKLRNRNAESGWTSVNGICNLVVYGPVHGIRYGDEISVTGKLIPLSPATSPGVFDFSTYYRSRGQSCSIHALYPEAVKLLKRKSNWWHLAQWRCDLRALFSDRLDAYVGKQADFASAILLGNRERLSPDSQDIFLTTGTAHLLAISGLHVGILATMFLFAYQFGLLSRRRALYLATLFVIGYAWLVEFRPPVSRAAILLSLYCGGRLMGLRSNHFNLLATAGLIVLMINPRDLFQLGPQLSFLAFASIVLFKDFIYPPLSMDPLDRLIRNTRPWPVRMFQRLGRRCWQAFAVCAVIWAIGLPLVAYRFHVVTPVAILVNPIVVPLVGIALFSGLGVCALGEWGGPLTVLLGSICSTSLTSVENVIGNMNDIRYGHWWTSGPNSISVWIFYVLLLGWGLFRARLGLLTFGFVWLWWILAAWALPTQLQILRDRQASQEFSVTFLDVRHGLSVVLQLPYGRTILYDAGSLSSSRFASEVVSRGLWSMGINHLDAIVVSHADLDHFNGIPKISQRFSVGAVYVNQLMFERTTGAAEAFRRHLKPMNIPIRVLQRYDRVRLPGQVQLTILHPAPGEYYESDNASSIVLLAKVGDQKVLLTGDLEGSGLEGFLNQLGVDCDVVLFPHHGSIRSLPDRIVRWSTPEFGIISASRRKLDPEVVRKIDEVGCRVFATANVGTIRMSVRDGRLEWSHWSGDRWQGLE